MSQKKGTVDITSVRARQEMLDNCDKKHKPTRRLNKGAMKHFDAIMHHRPYAEWPEDDRIVAETLAEIMVRIEAALKDPDIKTIEINQLVAAVGRMRSTLNLHQAGKVRTQQKTGIREELGRRFENAARLTKAARANNLLQ